MSTVEERKKNRIKKIIGVIIDSNPITGISTKVSKKALSLLKGKLTKEKEFTLEGLIKDLKSEQKLSKGDRGEAESIPKKEFEKSINKSKPRNPLINEKGEPRIFINLSKGGSIKTYAKGGGVRKPKMTAGY